MMKSNDRERGVVAVEFAMIIPLLLLLILAVVEFGYRYERGTVANNAALIAAREMSINHDQSRATTAAHNAGVPTSVTPVFSPSTCSTGNNVTVTITVSQTSPTKAFGNTFTVTGRAVARCDG